MGQQNVHGINESNAVLLLAAAQELNLDPGVVQTTTSGYFVVPEEVAKKAGFDENGLPSAKAAKKAADKEAEREAELEAARQADAKAAEDAAKELASQTSNDPDANLSDDDDAGDGELKGEALEQALKDRGLSGTGLKADEKRAAVAEFDAKNGS